MHLVHFTIPVDWDQHTIKQYLRGELMFSMHQISRVKYRPTGFLVNGESRWVNDILRAGDDLCFALDDPETHVSGAGSPLPVLYEDDFILAVSKPAGMVSHPSHGHHGDSALDLLMPVFGKLYLIGRLDKDTSGILLFAKHEETASLLSKQKESGMLYKTYLACVSGIPEPPDGTLSAPIAVAQPMPLKMKTDPQKGKPAVTHYHTIRTGFDFQNHSYSVLSVTIEHGRTHQIRVHLSSAGYPLVGDRLYGIGHDSYALLHAAELHFIHPYTREAVHITAPAPDWF